MTVEAAIALDLDRAAIEAFFLGWQITVLSLWIGVAAQRVSR